MSFAKDLAVETGLADVSDFVLSNIYDLPGPLAGRTFDVVYTSVGAIGWLPDIKRWAKIVASFVKPGGIFYIYEGHPLLWVVADEQRTPKDLRLAFDYWSGDVITTPVKGSYADTTAEVDAEWEHGWNHSLGETITALAAQGLRVEMLDEKRTVPWPVEWLVELEDGKYGFPPEQAGTMPLMFALRMRRDV